MGGRMKKLLLFIAVCFLIIIITACGAQPPLTHSEGPPLVAPVTGRQATVFVDRGTVKEVVLLSGLVRANSVPLFFSVDGLLFEAFHVRPGETVHEGQLLATLYIPHRREQVENQETHIARLNRAHTLAAELWENEYELMNQRYIERLRTAAENYDEAAMEDAQRLYLDMDRSRLEREQEMEWQRIERADAYARLAELREGLENTELLAPFDGMITFVFPINYGSSVNTLTWVLFIAPLDAPYIVEFTGDVVGAPSRPPELSIPRIKQIFGDINGHLYELNFIPLTREEIAYNSLHGLERRIRFSLPDGADVPLGAHVRLIAHYEYIPDALRIPSNAIVSPHLPGGTPYVYRRENNTWVPVYPTFGITTTSFIEIISGLSEGDEIRVN
jgi:multidrug efflux pump subunit AcrA (membrane-fusion protein)